jgi:mono/diheme cytochrome c family protein
MSPGSVALIVVAMLPVSAGLAPRGQVRPPPQDYTSGPYLYRTFCASCHGESGKGDGPMADHLRQRPPDLGTIALGRGGVFPRSEVSSIIDGRKPVPGHGSADMPVWGDVLRATQGHDDAIIRRRIDALVMHLMSIQTRKGGGVSRP